LSTGLVYNPAVSESSTTPPVPPRVLAVGAYERDNFGDLLFLQLTERYLPGSDVVASAPFAADMTALLDRQVVAVGDELAEHDYDVVWTVGGQVGATTAESAFRMSKPPAEYVAYRDAAPAEQREILRTALHGAPLVSPYIPTLGAFERNAGAVSVLNSVGLGGAAGHAPHVKEEVLEVFRTTDVVSVRDRESSKLFERRGIPHLLAPDVVHSISLLEPYETDPGSDIVVVQAGTTLLRRFGHERLARKLVESEHLDGTRFHLLMAGAATGHDSLDELEILAEHVRRLDPGREVEVLAERRPMDIVHQIRQAKIVVGTSLHVRIVAAAYSLPRVTLRRPKPARYATMWDDLMPFNVEGDELDDALGAALAAGRRPEVRAASERLSRLADENVRSIVERVSELSARGMDAEREQLAERRRARYAEISARRENCAVVTDKLRGELAEAQVEIARLRAQVPIRRSPTSLLRRVSSRISG
jgi:hypothetical protein